jgi:hypothetical protein
VVIIIQMEKVQHLNLLLYLKILKTNLIWKRKMIR